MKTELKDVLHLYLGVDVETPFRIETQKGELMKRAIGKLMEVDLYGETTRFGVILEKEKDKTNYKYFAAISLKPILRPLSDMTEDEKHIIRQMGVFENSPISGRLGQKVSYGFTVDPKEWGFECCLYLLKQGFDLFGLIESGQAIKK